MLLHRISYTKTFFIEDLFQTLIKHKHTSQLLHTMLGSVTGRPLKPKYGSSNSWIPHSLSYKFKRLTNQSWVRILLILLVFFLFLKPFSALSWLSGRNSHVYSRGNPFTSKATHVIEKSSKYIYPPIEHAPLLKQLTSQKLVEEIKVRDSNFPEIEKSIIRSFNSKDDPDPVKQKVKEEEENALSDVNRAINAFKNQDKVVFKPKNSKNYPKVIIVTTVDFEKYSVEALTNIVQNRVDYAHEHNYGIYVRWYQEFLPVLNSFSYLKNKDKARWVRLYCLRAAMYAFPEAEWFWFLDEDSLIMNQAINLNQYLLASSALDPAMLKGQPIIPPDGIVKTSKTSKPDSIKLIITQSDNKLETNSFLMKNDNTGKSMVEMWFQSLYFNYGGFPYGPDSAITHILQWHPFVLSRTAIVPARTISAKHSEIELPSSSKGGDSSHYYDGDFVVEWSDCEDTVKSEVILNKYYSKIQKLKNKKTN